MHNYALISVSDKTGVGELAARLRECGYEIISTGGTYKALKASGVAATPLERFTGCAEILDGRVKTLHPKIHAGILADRSRLGDADYVGGDGANHANIDVVVCNLYPFAEVAARADADFEEAIENIDIGGVTLIRAAAKNFKYATVVIDPRDYDDIANKLSENRMSEKDRLELAIKAFEHIAAYDRAVAQYLKQARKRSGTARRIYTTAD